MKSFTNESKFIVMKISLLPKYPIFALLIPFAWRAVLNSEYNLYKMLIS